MKTVLGIFEGERGPVRLALLALILGLPALGLGFQTDDHLIRWSLAHGQKPWELYQMTPEFVSARRGSGFFPWWTSEAYQLSFLRPLSSLSHALDFALYPDRPALMLLVNVLVYGAVVFVAARLYRRLLPNAATAAWAGLMFALDEGHALSVGWIAGRNTLLAALFSFMALHFATRPQARWSAASSTLCVALALLSAEAGVWSLALLIALHPAGEAGWGARMRALAPQLAVAVLWALVYAACGRGARGSGWYRDPHELASIVAGLADLPLWIAGLLGPTGMSLAILSPAVTARLVALPIALLLLALLVPSLRRVPSRRRFLFAALLCLAPVALTVPSARLTFGASFAAFALIALSSEGATGRLARATRVLFLGVHVWLALPSFQLALRTTASLEGGVRKLLASTAAASSDVILVRSPFDLLSAYVSCFEASCGDVRWSKRKLHQLYSGGSDLYLERTADNVLTLTASQGFARTPMESIYAAHDQLPAVGEERSVAGMQVRVLSSTPDGRPRTVSFAFPTAVDSRDRTFLNWQGSSVVPWRPPPLGRGVHIPALAVSRAFAPR